MRINTRLTILDDLASDMRADYRDMLTYGWSPEDAEKEMITVYMGDLLEDEELIAWCILAKEEWSHGCRPGKFVLDKTIQEIDRELQSDPGKCSKSEEEYRTRLKALKEQLLSDPPMMRKLQKKKPVLSPWKLGDCVAVKMTSDIFPHLDGQYGILRTVEIAKSRQSRYSTVENEVPWLAPLFWYGSEIPTDTSAILACGYTMYQPKPMMSDSTKDILSVLASEIQLENHQRMLKALQVICSNHKDERSFIASLPVFNLDPSLYPLPKLQPQEKDLGTLYSCYSLDWDLANWIGNGYPYFISE